MKTKNQIQSYALFGLLAALTLNLSFTWSGVSGSSDEASSRSKKNQSFRSCIMEQENASDITKVEANCLKKSNGKSFDFDVKIHEVEETYYVDKEGHEVGKRERKSGDKVDSAQRYFQKQKLTEAKKDTEEELTPRKRRALVAEITVGVDVKNCDTCDFEDSRTVSLKADDIKNFGDIASALGKEMENMMYSANEVANTTKEKEREEDRIAKGYKMCRNDEDGERYDRNGDEDDLDAYFDCVETQAGSLKGQELANFMNNHVFQAGLQSMFYNPQMFSRYVQALQGSGAGGMVNATLDNLVSFNRDYMMKNAYQNQIKNSGLPEAQMQQELNRINSMFDNYVAGQARNLAQMQPGLASQYWSIEQTMKTGIPPYSEFGLTEGGYSTLRNLGSGAMFSLDLARSSIGLTGTNNSVLGTGYSTTYPTSTFSSFTPSTQTRPVPTSFAARDSRSN